jgi:methylenetetrahydrofolate--tRNA-(uracil-5-)-methyltransferase
MGIYVAMQLARKLQQKPFIPAPRATAYGSLLAHLQDETPREFAPMNINWGIMPDPIEPTRDKGIKRAKKIKQANIELDTWLNELCL